MSNLEKEIEDLIFKRKNLEQQSLEIEKASNALQTTQNVIINEQNSEIIQFRKDTNKQLQAAKLSHKRWMSYVQILIRLGDIKIANTSIPVNYTMCDFGKWFYSEGTQIFSNFPEYDQIENVHQHVHDTYLQIYQLYATELKGSLFNSLKKQTAEREAKAIQLSKVLDEYSKIMFELLNFAQNILKDMSDQELKALMK